MKINEPQSLYQIKNKQFYHRSKCNRKIIKVPEECIGENHHVFELGNDDLNRI